ncbi:MAG: AMP-binding protein [Mycobacteriales bacterium]
MGAAKTARGRTASRPNNLGMVFEHFAGSDGASWHLDRPFDLAPKGDTRYTVAELAQLVAETSAGLYEVGLRAGDRVALIKDNHLDSVVLAAAAARIGAIPALCSATVRPALLQRMMQRLEPRVLVASSTVLADAAGEGVDLVPKGVPTIVVGGTAGDSGTLAALPTFADLSGATVPPARPRRDDEPMVCTHTSGTTGMPKFVVHSANTSIGTNARLETMRIPFLSTRDDDVIVSSIAFVHVRCLTWTVAQLTLPPKDVVVIADPSPDAVVGTLTAHRPTTLEACPNIFQLWEGLTRTHPELFANVRAYLSTFDAIHPPTVRAFLRVSKRRLPVWGQSWGQSEFGPASLAVYTRRSVRERRSAGRSGAADRAFTTDVGFPIPGVIKWKVVDPVTRHELPRGQRGLVLVRSRGRCLTYLGEDDRHRAKDWDGWWNTGDIGVHRRSGRLRILDREVDSIPGTSGIELESLLLDRLDGATEVIVLGNPGGLPVPVVSMRGDSLDPAAWRRATAGLPALDEPRLIGWDEFPRTGTWKVRRPELRQRILHSTETFGTGNWT